MIEAAKVLTVLAAMLAGASLHPRVRRWTFHAAMVAVAGVALCMAWSAFQQA